MQKVLYKPETTLETIINTYKEWVAKDQYLIFEHQRFHERKRHIASLVPKRGNPKYAYKVRKKFQEFTLPFEYEKKLIPQTDETQTNIIFLTLTYDTKLSDFKTAWSEKLAYNRFMANLRKIYGSVYSVRTNESSEKGYPHTHVILYFPDHTFPTWLKWSNKHNKYVWRIPYPEVEKIARHWHSHVDVQGMPNLADGLKYISKYITKTSDLSKKSEKTIALMWAFRKRSYSLGKKFKEEIFKKYFALDLTHLSLTQTISTQMTLDNKELRETFPSYLKLGFEKCKMIGIVDKNLIKKLGGIPKNQWNFGTTDKQTEFILYYFYGKQKDRSCEPLTPQEFIKNTWKYLEEKDLDPVSRKKIYEQIKKKQNKNRIIHQELDAWYN